MSWKNYDPVLQLPHLYDGEVSTDGVVIPTTDDVAYDHFKDFRWAYNKMTICHTQKIPHGPIGTQPTEYPICVKPIINLFGGSLGSVVCKTEEEYRSLTNPGVFWSRYAMGDHYSIDYIILDGHIMKSFAFLGHKLQHGSFDYWELAKLPLDVEDILADWIYNNFLGYTGCLNVEVIGTQIIEAQLRMGDIDRFGDHELMQAIHTLYNDNVWSYEENEYTPKTFYLAALFAQKDIKFTINKRLFDYSIGNQLIYYQFDDPDLYFTNPEHGNRVALFCDSDFDSVIAARNIAIEMISPDIDGKYLSPLSGYLELSI